MALTDETFGCEGAESVGGTCYEDAYHGDYDDDDVVVVDMLLETKKEKREKKIQASVNNDIIIDTEPSKFTTVISDTPCQFSFSFFTFFTTLIPNSDRTEPPTIR